MGLQRAIELREEQDRASSGVSVAAAISFAGQNESAALPDLSRIVTEVAAKVRAGLGATPEFPCRVICDCSSPPSSFSQVSQPLRPRILLLTCSMSLLPKQPLSLFPRNRKVSARRGQVRRRRTVRAGSIVLRGAANAGSRLPREPRQ